jgi:DNA polymerase alpha-associated DNA helicase A
MRLSYGRMKQTMTRMTELKSPTPFVQVLFGLASPTPIPSDYNNIIGPTEWINQGLNESQKEAIKFALASREVSLVHGPPGTGKTSQLIELILQMLKQGQRLLVCGPSNISVDNIVERLAIHKVPMLRVGHPARLLPSVLNHSLEVLTKTSEAATIVQDVRKEMDIKQASIRKTRSGRERRAIYADLKELRREYRERERDCVDTLVRNSKVILATLHGAGSFSLKAEQFDAVIIDEASQAMEAQCWVPLLNARKVVLAGDPHQLPPTIKSLNYKSDGGPNLSSNKKKGMSLETTLFDRLLRLHGPSIKRMLNTQYRMHETIMSFPSSELYESKLIAAEAVKARLLKDLPYGVDDTEDTREPLVFIDTQGGDYPENVDDINTDHNKKAGILGESKSNSSEVSLVKKHVIRLIKAGVRSEDIGVITPYNAQASLSVSTPVDGRADMELLSSLFSSLER